MKPRDSTRNTRRPGADRHYRELYENMPVMYFEMDERGIVLSVNAFGAEQLGYTSAELVGRSVTDVFHEDDRDAVVGQFRSLIGGGEGLASWEFRKRRKDGSVLWVRETARSIRSEGGAVEVVVVCQDITDRKRAEEERREAERLVRQLSLQLDEAQERERRRIAVHLHDDVGQTLTAISLKLAQLDGPAGPELSEVKDLLEVAIQGTRSLTFELASPVLYELGLADALRSLCEGRRNDCETVFRFECAGNTGAIPERVAVPLYRIASELVFNVRKHARARRARIRLACRGGRIELTVEDDGQGFDPDAIRETSAGPTGIGLFSIQQRVDLLGGKVEIRSAPGSGTRVAVSVGLDAGHAEA